VILTGLAPLFFINNNRVRLVGVVLSTILKGYFQLVLFPKARDGHVAIASIFPVRCCAGYFTSTDYNLREPVDGAHSECAVYVISSSRQLFEDVALFIGVFNMCDQHHEVLLHRTMRARCIRDFIIVVERILAIGMAKLIADS